MGNQYAMQQEEEQQQLDLEDENTQKTQPRENTRKLRISSYYTQKAAPNGSRDGLRRATNNNKIKINTILRDLLSAPLHQHGRGSQRRQ